MIASAHTICDSQKARMASAQAQLREWQAEQRTAEADLRRADAMRADKIISEENWEHAKYRVDETIDEVARYREETAAAEADLNTANVQLEQSRIVAPFAGVVGRSTVRPAQEVKPGRRALLDHRRSAAAGAVHRARNLDGRILNRQAAGSDNRRLPGTASAGTHRACQSGGRSGKRQRAGDRRCGPSVTAAEAGNVDAGAAGAMNLSRSSRRGTSGDAEGATVAQPAAAASTRT